MYRTQLDHVLYCSLNCATVILLYYTVPSCATMQKPRLNCFHQRKLWLPVLPACPLSIFVIPGISHHPHPEGEPCIYILVRFAFFVLVSYVQIYFFILVFRCKEHGNVPGNLCAYDKGWYVKPRRYRSLACSCWVARTCLFLSYFCVLPSRVFFAFFWLSQATA